MPSKLSITLGVLVGVAAIIRGLFEVRDPGGANIVTEFQALNVTVRDPDVVVQRFSGILRYQTTSSMHAPHHVKFPQEFENLLLYLEKSFPLVWTALDVLKVNDYSLLIKWQGRNVKLKPVMCISHVDVVPVGSESAWTHPPFSGAVADGFVWGRGAQDVKVTVTALLEAVTELLHAGYIPERTLYLAFGHDEEVGGEFGAGATAALLQQEGVELEMILDEGGGLALDGLPPLTSLPVARIGLAEKGYISMEVLVRGQGGHSSVPPIHLSKDDKPITQLATLLRALEGAGSPVRLVPTVQALLQGLAPSFDRKAVRWLATNSHHWAVQAVLAHWLAYISGNPRLAAICRSTAAVTDVFTSPPGDNVLPDSARVVVNFRPLPGEVPDYPERFLRGLLHRAGVDAQLRRLWAFDPPRPTPPGEAAYQLTRRAILETLVPPGGKLLVVPGLETGGTDSWSYQNLTRNILRFDPIATNGPEDLARVHGVDERCSIPVYLNAIRFYVRFLQLALAEKYE